MGYKSLKVPEYCEAYTKMGYYKERPVYVSTRVPIKHVAFVDAHSEGICINNVVFNTLQKSESFIDLVDTICEHDYKSSTMTPNERVVVDYLKDMGVDV